MGASALMIRLILLATLSSFGAAGSAQSAGFQPLTMTSGKDTAFQQYALRLAGPDNPDKPAAWQGPLTIAHGSATCTADVSLVTGVYASPGRGFVLVLTTSGSSAIAHFVDLASCAEKWPPIRRAASGVRVAGNRLSFLPACEGGGSNAPAQCTAARVYSLKSDDTPPAILRSTSYKLTEKELGVGFTGEAKVMDPRTPRAIVVH
jgi:hypothetical protein